MGGVIAGAGSLGLLIGMLRGRLVKRVFYTGLGVGLGTAVSYPEEAKKTFSTVDTETRKAVTETYNWITGSEEVLTNSTTTKPKNVVFLNSSVESAANEIEGDPGMSSEEDKDL